MTGVTDVDVHKWIPGVAYCGRIDPRERPEKLWFQGNHHHVLGKPMVAIVGARSCTKYGLRVARRFASELAEAGIVVVSGLAMGVDAEAHRGTFDAAGRTVAVMATGIDLIYPTQHAALSRRILEEGGLLLSEYEPGVEPATWRFPARNRIIAGISQAVIVIEARKRSGSLITADYATEYGVPLYAVPGPITSPLSDGTNDLIRDGRAKCITTTEHLIKELGEKEAL